MNRQTNMHNVCASVTQALRMIIGIGVGGVIMLALTGCGSNTCSNGTAQTMIPASGAGENCRSCNNGYHLDGQACVANTYTCANGTAADHATQGKNNGAEFCVACESGYEKVGNSCLINEASGTINTVDVNACGITGCINCYTYEGDDLCRTCGSGFVKVFSTCRPTVYLCPGGEPRSGNPPGNDDFEICESCNDDYTLGDDNICRRFGNTRASDVDYTVDGSTNSHIADIWIEGDTLWALDWFDDIIYAYTITDDGLEDNSAENFETLIAAGNMDGESITVHDGTMWVLDGDDNIIYAYTIDTKERDEDRDIALEDNSEGYKGHWSDGVTVWVIDGWAWPNIYAYTLPTGDRDADRDADRDIDLEGGSFSGVDLWSDGTIMWVLDAYYEIIRAFDMSTGIPISSNNIGISSGTGIGMWGNGETLWVAPDIFQSRITAYQ